MVRALREVLEELVWTNLNVRVPLYADYVQDRILFVVVFRGRPEEEEEETATLRNPVVVVVATAVVLIGAPVVLEVLLERACLVPGVTGPQSAVFAEDPAIFSAVFPRAPVMEEAMVAVAVAPVLVHPLLHLLSPPLVVAR